MEMKKISRMNTVLFVKGNLNVQNVEIENISMMIYVIIVNQKLMKKRDNCP
ncbi:hypothetical protein CCAN12_760033 [Capnocytophaga canimorsus]|uniref:Uncharacterized protein n=1 Tax=Capnocytophaga canimorsus TaxID=28188 RepID=A0A0B7HJA9_9FLAO|nr:hypothetical protein CCAN12_760033 [Capnocytophaga canimorsus]